MSLFNIAKYIAKLKEMEGHSACTIWYDKLVNAMNLKLTNEPYILP